jgi:hypothetical protein
MYIIVYYLIFDKTQICIFIRLCTRKVIFFAFFGKNFQGKECVIMKELLISLGIIGIWFLLQVYILPKMGIAT